MTHWQGRQEGWLKDYVHRKRVNRVIEAPPIPHQTKTANSDCAVFMRPRCPKCKEKKYLRCYKTDDKIRYYQCKCGHKFKANEIEN